MNSEQPDSTSEHSPDARETPRLPRTRPRPPRMPSVGLRLRLRTSPSLRRGLPRTLVERRALRRGAEIWEQNADEREHAIASMEAIVGATSRAGEVDRLAREALIERKVEARCSGTRGRRRG